MKDLYFKVSEWARARLAIAVEITEQRVRIGIARTSQSGCERSGSAEAEISGPGAARRFTIQQPLKIGAELQTVIAMSNGEVIGKGGFDKVLSRLAPATKPVNVSGCTRDTAPTSSRRDQAQAIILRKELGRRVV